MEVIVSRLCKSLTGSIGSGFGYFIVQRGDRFYGVRSKHGAPPDGHWKFIEACVFLAKNKLHIVDVNIRAEELQRALHEARHYVAAQMVHDNYYGEKKKMYNAADIHNLKITFGL